VNLSSPFITLPGVGGGEGQMSFTRAVYDLFFAKKRQEVLIMGGYVAGGQGEQAVTKMIVEPNGTIRFEASTPMLRARYWQGVVYHQGEVLSISTGYNPVASRGTMERLDTLTQAQTELVERLPNNLCFTTAAIFNNKLVVVGGRYDIAGQVVNSDIVYELDDHASQAAQGRWRALTARLNTARRLAAAIAHEGKLFVIGGRDAGGTFRSVESFDPATGAWQLEGNMTKGRCNFSLFVFQHELYAVGGDEFGNTTTIEKRNKATQQWELVADCGQYRARNIGVLASKRIVPLGSTIIFVTACSP